MTYFKVQAEVVVLRSRNHACRMLIESDINPRKAVQKNFEVTMYHVK